MNQTEITDQLMKIQQLVKAFQENPIRLTYSIKRLMKQYQANREEIKEAKKICKPIKLTKSIDEHYGIFQREDGHTELISLKQLGEMMGMNMDEQKEVYKDDLQTISKYHVVTDPYKENISNSEDKQIEIKLDWDNATPLPTWIEKEKWIKTKDGSTHLVNTSYVEPEGIDYKKEFQEFIDNYKVAKLPLYHVPNKGSKLAIVAAFDLHIGKIADFYYTGNVSNPLISEDDYQTEFAKLYTWLNTQDIEEVILPIGNDFFNVDDSRLTTKKGTQQDNSSNLSGLFALGLDLMCWTIDCLRQRWKTTVILVPGNHAPTVEGYLASSLKKIYEGTLEVDDRPLSRKYFKYGKNLLGFAHGDLKMNRYAELLPYEAKDMFSSCNHFEVIIGDRHIEETYKKATDEFDGVVIRRLAALTRTDQWHYHHGFTLSKRRSYVLIYDKENGLEIQYTNHANHA